MKPNMKHLALMIAVVVFGIVLPLWVAARALVLLFGGDAP